MAEIILIQVESRVFNDKIHEEELIIIFVSTADIKKNIRPMNSTQEPASVLFTQTPLCLYSQETIEYFWHVIFKSEVNTSLR